MEPSTEPRPPFAHASEAEFARILDFYVVRWEYEPHVFPILWNLDGLVVESFSPDFWLPDLELYIEMTTLKQSLVRKKNRKLRRLRELYPGIRIKLFYGRDFRALMLKYGKHGLIDAMSGTLGQSTPPRLATVMAGDAGADVAGAAEASPAGVESPAGATAVGSGAGPLAAPAAVPEAPRAAAAPAAGPIDPAPARPNRRARRRRGRVGAASRAASSAIAPVTTDD